MVRKDGTNGNAEERCRGEWERRHNKLGGTPPQGTGNTRMQRMRNSVATNRTHEEKRGSAARGRNGAAWNENGATIREHHHMKDSVKVRQEWPQGTWMTQNVQGRGGW